MKISPKAPVQFQAPKSSSKTQEPSSEESASVFGSDSVQIGHGVYGMVMGATPCVGAFLNHEMGLRNSSKYGKHTAYIGNIGALANIASSASLLASAYGNSPVMGVASLAFAGVSAASGLYNSLKLEE